MLGCARKITAAGAAISLGVASSVVASAPSAPAAAPASANAAPASHANPWLTLSAMTVSSSSASAAAAAQGEIAAVAWPHIVPLSVVLGTVASAIYLVRDPDNSSRERTDGIVPGLGLSPTPLSPA